MLIISLERTRINDRNLELAVHSGDRQDCAQVVGGRHHPPSLFVFIYHN